MVGRQLPFFSLIVPFWLIWAFAGWRGMLADLARDPGDAASSFAVPQFLISNFINPWIVDIGASLVSMACLIGFLKLWQPADLDLAGAPPPRQLGGDHAGAAGAGAETEQRGGMGGIPDPWIIVCASC